MSQSLEQMIQHAGSPARLLQNAQVGAFEFPVQSMHSNLIDEGQAWRKSAILFDQSFHMTELRIKGPDTKRLLSDFAVNNFAGFGANKAKQIVCCNKDGYLISDAIIFGYADDEVLVVGRPVVPNWLQFNAETGGYDVETHIDHLRGYDPNNERPHYRFEVQGPTAMALLEEVNEGAPLTTRFFGMGEITIAGCKAHTLVHAMGGAKGLEIWGPYADKARVEAKLLEVGRKHDLVRGGGRAYGITAAESGWLAAPLPAIYDGEEMRPYREWLTDHHFEGFCSVGGSFQPEDVRDYYLTPFELDYGRLIHWEHDFLGRDALWAMKDKPHRTKVTLVWSKEDVLKVFASLMEEGEMCMWMDLPSSDYAIHPYDRVEKDGQLVGISTYPLYSVNQRAWLSVAVVDPDHAAHGGQLSILWGEPDGGTAKPSVHRHRQISIGCTVAPWPIAEDIRRDYRAQT
ncbi:aminomethyl transferase family protein [Sphingobium terrigena]|uniref:Aminomethyl transferase family protein n=1 Tax=Sphingobium terrigena TaxID=2304063 RepID=A0A418YYG7_9SPHN|nr:aminomethyltransferase family protein [Sphingobium terrigena]RJG57906.1 aminomethyl transferase family protein [Sphingobium terrigena]